MTDTQARPHALAGRRDRGAVAVDQIMGETARKRALVLANALADAGDLDGADAALQDGLERCRAAGSRDDVAGHLLALAASRPGSPGQSRRRVTSPRRWACTPKPAIAALSA